MKTNNGQKRLSSERYRTPEADILEDENTYYVVLDLPGVSEETLEVTYENGNIDIIGRTDQPELEGFRSGRQEYYSYPFRRQFSLSDQINAEQIEAVLKDGELQLKLPKSEAIKPRKIAVTSV